MEPELIVKEQFVIDCTGSAATAVPEILLLGNAAGLRQLGERLIEISERLSAAADRELDPDDHQHLSSRLPPFNTRLSDLLEFRIGVLTQSNRASVLSKYGISESSQQTGDLGDRYRRQAERAANACARSNQTLFGRERLARESAKLDPNQERSLAEGGLE